MTNPNEQPQINDDVSAAIAFALSPENIKPTRMIASLAEGTHTPEILIAGIEDLLKTDAFKDLGLSLVAAKDVLPEFPPEPSHRTRKLAALATAGAVSISFGIFSLQNSPEKVSSKSFTEVQLSNDEKTFARRALIGSSLVAVIVPKSEVIPTALPSPSNQKNTSVITRPEITNKRQTKISNEKSPNVTTVADPINKPVAAPRTLPVSPTPKPAPVSPKPATASPRPTNPTTTTSSPKPTPTPTRYRL